MFSSNTSQVSDEKLYSEDVFSTFLYTGTDATQAITNGIDLAGKGGLVWCKQRSSPAYDNALYDTARGVRNYISSNTTQAQVSVGSGIGLTAFNSNGFTLGADYSENASGATYASWTFRKAPKFFDVVTYTGNGSTQSISHNLGTAPGTIIVKSYGAGGSWIVYHQSLGAGSRLFLNATNAATTTVPETVWGNNTTTVAPTSTAFTTGSALNASGDTYVAYLFAHDTTSDGIIQCGSYTGNGSSTGPTVTLGWEPQWLLVKDATSAWDWRIVDNMRGMPVGSGAASLFPNLSNAEFTTSTVAFSPTATGFQVAGSAAQINTSGNTYIYVAIRRGPMRTPTSGTSVFSPQTSNASGGTYITTGFPVDFQWMANRDLTENKFEVDRLRGFNSPGAGTAVWLSTNLTNAEASNSNFSNAWDNTGFKVPSFGGGINSVYLSFRRAPGFFDVVCYTGTGSARTINHNLGVAPELIIIKCRSNGTTAWMTYCSALSSPNDKYLFLNQNSAVSTVAGTWKTPTATTFGMDISFTEINNSGFTYVSYLFASCPGVSKVGSYTGNGSSQTINCGFAAGARFVMIKRTDSTGDWYVWDTARGIVAGNDPHLSLNSTAAEVTTDDSVDTDSSGFVVNQLSATNINVSSATYIYLAVA